MWLTFAFFGSVFARLCVSLFLWAIFLRLGARWAKIKDVTRTRILAATLLVCVAQRVIRACFLLFSPANDVQVIVVNLVALVLVVLVAPMLIAAILHARFLRAFQAWLPTLVSSVGMFLFIYFVCNPFVFEAFRCSSNGMAPTLLGYHWQAACPRCGGLAYCSPAGDYESSRPTGTLMVCGNELLPCRVANPDRTVHPPDRFAVSKFLKPRRWDIVVFRYPEEPSTVYVMRLVGLPGEELFIRDGSVWIDGRRLEPPDSLRGLEYTTGMDGFDDKVWGHEDHPARLASDEYFVLGDFSPRAKDSRMWQQGAPGHAPYAVPTSHVVGVVTHIYWPPRRWRILR